MNLDSAQRGDMIRLPIFPGLVTVDDIETIGFTRHGCLLVHLFWVGEAGEGQMQITGATPVDLVYRQPGHRPMTDAWRLFHRPPLSDESLAALAAALQGGN